MILFHQARFPFQKAVGPGSPKTPWFLVVIIGLDVYPIGSMYGIFTGPTFAIKINQM